MARGVVEGLPSIELQAIRLATDTGFDWGYRQRRDQLSHPINSAYVDDVLEHIMSELYTKASNWSSREITAEIERWSEHD